MVHQLSLVVALFAGLVFAQGVEAPSPGPCSVPPLSDRDGDGLVAAAEWPLGLDPDNPDTDGDGVLDGIEACAPKGDGRLARVTERGPGTRLLVWREGAEFWVLGLVSGPATLPWDDLSIRVVSPQWERGIALEGLFTVTAEAGPVRTVATQPLPAVLLEALGGQLAFSMRLGGLGASATLLERSAGWGTLEPFGGRFRTIPAERRMVQPFPIQLHSGSRICAQELEPVGPRGGAFGYSIFMVAAEDCSESGPLCVTDCGSVIGRQVVILDPWIFRGPNGGGG